VAKVSVITPCFNGAKFIRPMIQSVQEQTLSDWTLTVVDDGSTDNSASIVGEAAALDRRIGLVRQENRGVSQARNAGFAAAPPSTYLLFLDADDLLLPDMLAIMTGYLDTNPDVGMAYCLFRDIDASGHDLVTDRAEHHPPKRFVAAGLRIRELPASQWETPLQALMSNHAAYPSVCVMRRDIYEQTSRWDPDFAISEDKDLVIQLALRAQVHTIPSHLVHYRHHDTSVMAGASAYPSLRQLEAKWWSGPGLSAGQRSRVRKAVLFDRWVTTVRQLQAAASSLKRGHLSTSARFVLHSARSFLSLLSRSALYPRQPAATSARVSTIAH
jgi:glycosyltransferase involved in cell wall biosynthesis